MAEWTDISDSVLEPNKPIRSVDGIALRDNPIAIAEGASGAPKVQSGALQDYPWGSEDFQTGDSENNWVRNRIASSNEGQVGTYALVAREFRGNVSWGGTVPGDALMVVYIKEGGGFESIPGTLSGTWRVMGAEIDNDRATLALRIS